MSQARAPSLSQPSPAPPPTPPSSKQPAWLPSPTKKIFPNKTVSRISINVFLFLKTHFTKEAWNVGCTGFYNEILCGDMKVKSESGLVQTFVANTGENKTPLGALLLVHRNPEQTSSSSGCLLELQLARESA